jgi:hypothetical protein
LAKVLLLACCYQEAMGVGVTSALNRENVELPYGN